MLATLRDFCGSWGVMSNIVPKHSSRIDQPFQEAGLIKHIFLFFALKETELVSEASIQPASNMSCETSELCQTFLHPWGLHCQDLWRHCQGFLQDLQHFSRVADEDLGRPRVGSWMPVGGCRVWFLMCTLYCILDGQTLELRMITRLLALSASCAFPLWLHALSCNGLSKIYLILDPKHTRD